MSQKIQTQDATYPKRFKNGRSLAMEQTLHLTSAVEDATDELADQYLAGSSNIDMHRSLGSRTVSLGS